MAPHPAVAAVRHAVRPYLDRAVLVACSGGADSLALAAAVAFEAPRHGVRAGLVTVDHGLQAGSAAQACRVAAIGYELGFDPVEIVPVSVGKTGGPEAAARAARYGALDAVADALDAHVLLGHTLDDQAETVLLGLGRGSGPRSLAGMRRRSGRYLRPLLGLRRATTEAACAALGLEPWRDPQNDDPALQRVRLRHEALPLLEDVLQGGVAEALARTAALVQDDLDALDLFVDQQARTVGIQRFSPDDQGEGGEWLAVDALEGLPRAVRTRLLRSWALVAGATEVTSVHIAAMAALVSDWHGQGPVDLPGGLLVRRASGRLVAESPQPLE
jgi:tRNA(Ile)-lysidine synthase